MTASVLVPFLTPRSTIPTEEQGNVAMEASVHSKKHVLKSAVFRAGGGSVRVVKDPVFGMRPGFKSVLCYYPAMWP